MKRLSSGPQPIFYCLFLILTGLFPYRGVIAQGKEFVPATEDISYLTGLYGRYEQFYKDELNQLPSQNRKDFQELYEGRWKNIKEKFDKREIYTALAAQAYLDALAGEIVKANPSLKAHPFHCYFSRSYIPNASYIGEGIILFNMGLFDRLASESEVVFIVCHEVAHYILGHQQRSMEKYVAAINSPEMQSQLRKIKGSEYGKHEQVQKLVKGVTFDSRRHSRDHEAQADSMGVELMRNTSFDCRGALTTLALLDNIDKDDFDTDASLRQTFNSKDYPFQKKWLHREEGLLGGHAHLDEEVMADSLKTHPACPERIRLLTPLVKAGGKGAFAFIVDSMKFASLKEQFRYEVVEYSYADSAYTESLFLTLRLLRDRPGDPYLVAHTGQLLNGLYRAQTRHILGKVTDLPAPGYSSNYNLLLQFVQNLYLEDLASISYYFLNPFYPQMEEYVSFKKTYAESRQLAEK